MGPLPLMSASVLAVLRSFVLASALVAAVPLARGVDSLSKDLKRSYAQLGRA
jgi:hypothetical protein